MDSFQDIDTDPGDRGNDIPDQVLPYVPKHHTIQRSHNVATSTKSPSRPFYSRHSIPDTQVSLKEDPWDKLIKKNTGSGVKHTVPDLASEYKTSSENSPKNAKSTTFYSICIAH